MVCSPALCYAPQVTASLSELALGPQEEVAGKDAVGCPLCQDIPTPKLETGHSVSGSENRKHFQLLYKSLKMKVMYRPAKPCCLVHGDI